MSHTNTLFSKILGLIDRREFNRFVKRHDGDKRSRTLRCWDQFTVMLYAQIKQASSGRAALDSFNSHEDKLYHIGANSIAKSTLNDANAKRSCEIFEDLFHSLVKRYQSEFDTRHVNEMITAIDSTQVLLPPSVREDFPSSKNKAALKIHTFLDLDQEIPYEAIVTSTLVNDIVIAKSDLKLEPGRTYVFDKGYYDIGWWYQINQAGAKFVTRLKTHTKPVFKGEFSQPKEKNILSDHVIELKSRKKGKGGKISYPKLLRRVIAKDDEGKEIQLVTNDCDSTAQEIADTYRSRWQIEIFFKWMKQKLKIKALYGRSPNAIKTQIYIAMIAYILLKMAHTRFMVGRSLKAFVRIVSEQLMIRHSYWFRPFETPNLRKRKGREDPPPSLFAPEELPI